MPNHLSFQQPSFFPGVSQGDVTKLEFNRLIQEAKKAQGDKKKSIIANNKQFSGNKNQNLGFIGSFIGSGLRQRATPSTIPSTNKESTDMADFNLKIQAIGNRKKAGIDVSKELSQFKNDLILKFKSTGDTDFSGIGTKFAQRPSNLLEFQKKIALIEGKPTALAPKVPGLKIPTPAAPKVRTVGGASRLPLATQGADATANLKSAATELDIGTMLDALKPQQRNANRSRLSFFLQGLGSARVNPNDSFGATLLQLGLGSLRGRAAFDQQKIKSNNRFDTRMDEFNKLKTLQLIKSKELQQSRAIASNQFNLTRQDRAATRDIQRSKIGQSASQFQQSLGVRNRAVDVQEKRLKASSDKSVSKAQILVGLRQQPNFVINQESVVNIVKNKVPKRFPKGGKEYNKALNDLVVDYIFNNNRNQYKIAKRFVQKAR